MLLSVTEGSVSAVSKPTDLVQGTLDLLILKVIALEPMHGWGYSPAYQAGLERRAASRPGLTLPGAP
jgi:hypothetical protein